MKKLVTICRMIVIDNDDFPPAREHEYTFDLSRVLPPLRQDGIAPGNHANVPGDHPPPDLHHLCVLSQRSRGAGTHLQDSAGSVMNIPAHRVSGRRWRTQSDAIVTGLQS